MAEAPQAPTAYFAPPSWEERQQLIAHLLRNAAGPIYLRGRSGAGKTRFLEHLLETLAEDLHIARLDVSQVRDAAALRAFASAAEGASAGRAMAILIDAADDAPADLVDGLWALERGGGRLLLSGRGGPAAVAANPHVQFIDLPALTPPQTKAFASLVEPRQAAPLTGDGGAMLWRETGGLPGKVVERLSERHGAAPPQRPQRRWSWLAGGAALVVMLGVTLWQQQAINAWIAGTGTEAGPVSVPSDPSRPDPGAPVSPPPAPRAEAVEGSGAVTTAEAPVEPASTPPEITANLPQPPPGDASGPAGRIEELTAALAPGADTGVEGVVEPELESPPADRTGVPVSPEPALTIDTPAAPPAEGQVPAEAADAPEPESAPAPAVDFPPAGVAEPAQSVTTGTEEGPPAQAASAVPAEATASTQTPPASALEPSSVRKPLGATPRTVALPGDTWLQRQPPDHFTLQLVGARDLEAIHRFIDRHGLAGQLAVFERDLDGRPWYALLQGSFPDREAALRSRGELPQPLANEAWVRPFADIRRYLIRPD